MPSSADLDRGLAEARRLLRAGQAREARLCSDQILKIDPANSAALEIRGQSYLAEQNFSEASKAFEAALRTAPKRIELLFQAAVAYQGQKEFEPAVQLIRNGLATAPDHPMLLAKLGHLYLLKEDPEAAVPYLRSAINSKPDFVPTMSFLATALTDLGKIGEARSVVRQALKIAPENPELLVTEGRIEQQDGQFDRAVASFQKALTVNPDLVAPYISITYSRKLEHSNERWIQGLERRLTGPNLAADDRSLLLYSLGKANDDLGQYEAAMQRFDQANKLCRSESIKSGQLFDRVAYSNHLSKLVDQYGPFGKRPISSASASNRPIFIVGMIRSGTTLVEQILSRHPVVAAGGEQRFWISTAFGDADREVTPQLVADRIREYDKVLDSISSTTRYCTDKMPINYQVLGAILTAYPNAKVLHCHRNPIDTCLSIYVTPFLHAPEFAHDRENIAFAYREYQGLMRRWKEAFPNACWHDVEYERMVTDPEPAVRELIAFLELPWDDRCLDPKSGERPVATPSQWQVRQPMHTGAIGRWKHYEAWLGALRTLSE